jgi:DeoR/GlpR family transcriptional regulator of sugar metabolism
LSTISYKDTMTTNERRQKIISMLKVKRFIKSTDFTKYFSVSGETIRRDLDYLQSQNLLQRVYGGAVLNTKASTTLGTEKADHQESIEAIGRAAAELILPGETVFLDTGVTVCSIAHHLKGRSNITVITSSLSVINELVDSDVTLITLGGIVSPVDGDIHGDLAVECTKYFYCDKVFFGCDGITPELGVMDYCAFNMTLHRHFYKRTDQYILVTSSKKFGRTSTMSICPAGNIDLIVTDTNLSPKYKDAFEALGVKFLLVDPHSDS